MTEERKGEVKTFGAKCKVFGGVNQKAQKAIEMAAQQEPEPELTIDEKLENVVQNTSTLFNEHSNALNSIAMWIAKQDAQVAKCGNVVDWAFKEMAKEERLAARKAEYKASK